MARMATAVVMVVVVVAAVLAGGARAQLKEGFYEHSCPQAEKIIKDYVAEHVPHVPGIAATLLRTHFHDCFVRGCDASVLLNATGGKEAERDAAPNLTLRSFGFINKVKAVVEKECPGVVSCADILALTARDSVVVTGGPSWSVPTGRRDGTVSIKQEALDQIPAPTMNFTQLLQSFQNKSLDLADLVWLSGTLEGVDGSRSSISKWTKMTSTDSWRWCLGLIYIVAVATIWIAASYIVQSVVDAGVSPFLITYICNSLFVVYIPIIEVARYFEDSVSNFWTKLKCKDAECLQQSADLESVNLLQSGGHEINAASDQSQTRSPEGILTPDARFPAQAELNVADCSKGLDAKGRWTRARVAKVSMIVCPFWFLAQLTFNLSLRYTTVTSNTVLSTMSSLFTFLVALVFLGETFTWLKLVSVLLCMAGTVIVSLADSSSSVNAIATNPLLGDFLCIVSAGFYAIYITLIRKKLPDEKEGKGKVSMAQFLGFLGLFNMLFFLPVALVLNFAKLEPFHRLTWEQVGLIVGKGLLDNVLSDYLWAKAVLLTTTTVATAGLTIQVPIAAVVDSLTGHAPHLLNYIGAAAVLVGFAGINIPAGESPQAAQQEQETPIIDDPLHLPTSRNATDAIS